MHACMAVCMSAYQYDMCVYVYVCVYVCAYVANEEFEQFWQNRTVHERMLVFVCIRVLWVDVIMTVCRWVWIRVFMHVCHLYVRWCVLSIIMCAKGSCGDFKGVLKRLYVTNKSMCMSVWSVLHDPVLRALGRGNSIRRHVTRPWTTPRRRRSSTWMWKIIIHAATAHGRLIKAGFKPLR